MFLKELSTQSLGPPARCPFSPFFGREGSPSKIDKAEQSWYPFSNLSNLEDIVGVCCFSVIPWDTKGVPLFIEGVPPRCFSATQLFSRRPISLVFVADCPTLEMAFLKKSSLSAVRLAHFNPQIGSGWRDWEVIESPFPLRNSCLQHGDATTFPLEPFACRQNSSIPPHQGMNS